MRRLASLALLAALLLAATASAAPLWGTRTEVTLGDLLQSGGQNNFSFDADGPTDLVTGLSVGGALATNSQVDDATQLDSKGTGPWNRGVSEASAELHPSSIPPTLRARAILTGNHSGQAGAVAAAATAEAFASDLYEYIGSGPTNLSITFTLTGSVGNFPADPTFATGLFASVAVIEPANYFFSTDLGALRFDTNHPVVKVFDTSTLVGTADTSGGTVTLEKTLTFSLVPGEQFYVWQKLAAWASGGSRSADAFSTMTATFDQPGLVRSLAVPEPGTAALLDASLLGLAALGKRKRATRD
jgi:hypothetical protein